MAETRENSRALEQSASTKNWLVLKSVNMRYKTIV